MKKKKKESKKKIKKKIQEIKIHAIRSFPAGSFAVHIGDHLRFGIICGPIWGSFAVWGSFAALYNTDLFPREQLIILKIRALEPALSTAGQ